MDRYYYACEFLDDSGKTIGVFEAFSPPNEPGKYYWRISSSQDGEMSWGKRNGPFTDFETAKITGLLESGVEFTNIKRVKKKEN